MLCKRMFMRVEFALGLFVLSVGSGCAYDTKGSAESQADDAENAYPSDSTPGRTRDLKFTPEQHPEASPVPFERLRVEFDQALRSVSDVTLEQLREEARVVLEEQVPERKLELEKAFDERRRDVMFRATERMKQTFGTFAFEMMQGTSKQDANVERRIVLEADGKIATAQSALTVCETPFEWEPVPPYFDSAAWGGGSVDRASGTFGVASGSTIAGDSWDGMWVRADHWPWNAGRTTVTARINFGSYSVAVISVGLGYTYADIHTQIRVADGAGGWAATCPLEVVNSVGAWIGAPEAHGSIVVLRSCSYPNRANQLYSSLVTVQGHTVAGGLGTAQSTAHGVIESIRAQTCFER